MNKCQFLSFTTAIYYADDGLAVTSECCCYPDCTHFTIACGLNATQFIWITSAGCCLLYLHGRSWPLGSCIPSHLCIYSLTIFSWHVRSLRSWWNATVSFYQFFVFPIHSLFGKLAGHRDVQPPVSVCDSGLILYPIFRSEWMVTSKDVAALVLIQKLTDFCQPNVSCPPNKNQPPLSEDLRLLARRSIWTNARPNLHPSRKRHQHRKWIMVGNMVVAVCIRVHQHIELTCLHLLISHRNFRLACLCFTELPVVSYLSCIPVICCILSRLRRSKISISSMVFAVCMCVYVVWFIFHPIPNFDSISAISHFTVTTPASFNGLTGAWSPPPPQERLNHQTIAEEQGCNPTNCSPARLFCSITVAQCFQVTV